MSALPLAALAIQPLSFKQQHRNIATSFVSQHGPDIDLGDCPDWVADIESLYPNRHFQYQVLEPGTTVVIDEHDFTLVAHLCSNTSLNQHLVLFELHTNVSEANRLAIEKVRAALVLDTSDQRLPAIVQCIDAAG